MHEGVRAAIISMSSAMYPGLCPVYIELELRYADISYFLGNNVLKLNPQVFSGSSVGRRSSTAEFVPCYWSGCTWLIQLISHWITFL